MPNLKNKLNKGEVEVGYNLIWLATKWTDKKDIYMLKRVHEVGFFPTGKKHYKTNKDIIKPICVVDYNLNMDGVDNIDRQLSLSENVRKTMK